VDGGLNDSSDLYLAQLKRKIREGGLAQGGMGKAHPKQL